MNKCEWFYFSENYLAAISRRRPWWEYVFFHGEYDRDDKVVDWVIRRYSPNDGMKRHPLRIHRNAWLVPNVTTAGISLVVSEKVRDALVRIGTTLEFLEVVFEHPYEIPWGEEFIPPLDDAASDATIKRFTKEKRFATDPISHRRFEIIAPAAKKCNPLDGQPYVLVTGKLEHTRTVEVPGDVINIAIDAGQFLHHQALNYGGCGLICKREVADVLMESAHPEWFSRDELNVQSGN